MNYQLILNNLSLNVKLGHTEAERLSPQQVLVQIKLHFIEPPLACSTDDLQDTLCYAALSNELQKFCDACSFKLIEFLCAQLYQVVKKKIVEMTSKQIKVCVCVTKDPPLNSLEQSSFLISD